MTPAKVDALLAACAVADEVRKDAERYRFLRDVANPNDIPDMIYVDPKRTDEAIDAAIAAAEAK